MLFTSLWLRHVYFLRRSTSILRRHSLHLRRPKTLTQSRRPLLRRSHFPQRSLNLHPRRSTLRSPKILFHHCFFLRRTCGSLRHSYTTLRALCYYYPTLCLLLRFSTRLRRPRTCCNQLHHPCFQTSCINTGICHLLSLCRLSPRHLLCRDHLHTNKTRCWLSNSLFNLRFLLDWLLVFF